MGSEMCIRDSDWEMMDFYLSIVQGWLVGDDAGMLVRRPTVRPDSDTRLMVVIFDDYMGHLRGMLFEPSLVAAALRSGPIHGPE